MRVYKRRNNGLPGSKLPEQTYNSIVRGFVMAMPPTEVAAALDLAPQTVRLAFSKIRSALAQQPGFYYAALYVLASHTEMGAFLELYGLQRLALPGRFQGEYSASAFRCVFQCPASLPPRRLRKAYELAARIPKPTLLNPTPYATAEKPEPHGRHRCANCMNRDFSNRVNPMLLDAISVEMSTIRTVNAQNFDQYFFLYAFRLVMNKFFEITYDEAIRDGATKEEADAVANSKYLHIIIAVTKLVMDIVEGRKFQWHDDGEPGSGEETLY